MRVHALLSNNDAKKLHMKLLIEDGMLERSSSLQYKFVQELA